MSSHPKKGPHQFYLGEPTPRATQKHLPGTSEKPTLHGIAPAQLDGSSKEEIAFSPAITPTCTVL